ncbi:MAG: Gfo/Idh/MocA family oxidoreductase [Nitrospiraceae bacterium]|nr:Gfo/Idh/MocA family oxidoreductase [Nitrospiraceae bacterium]
MPGIGVIGAGYLGRHHARVYATLDGARLAGVADLDRESAEEVASTYGARAYTDFREMLGSVDAVSIVTPTETHYDIAMECLKNGKDVLLEKPMCYSVEEADALIREAQARKLILQVGHVERFNPAAIEALSHLDSPSFIEAERVSPFPARSTDVDVTLDIMIHDIDIALHVFGCPEASVIRAAGSCIVTEKLDTVKAWVDFENGCSAFFSASRIAAEKRRVMKFMEKNRFVKVDFLAKKVTVKTSAGQEDIEPAASEPLKEELADFIRCIRGRGGPRVSPREARQALALALKISQTVRSTF